MLGSMTTQAYSIYIERKDAARNMARFYAMTIDHDLFEGARLSRHWGRIGTRGQTMVLHFPEERAAVRCFLMLLQRKRARGYRPVGVQTGAFR